MPQHERLFAEAGTVVNELLRALDVRAPGLFADVYIGGDFALNDGQPGVSEIQAALVMPEPVPAADALAIVSPVARLTSENYPLPRLCGIAIGRADLAANPLDLDGTRVCFRHGEAQLLPSGELLTPLFWQTLRQGGVTWRGLPINQATIWEDTAALQSWARAELETRWLPWLHSPTTIFSPATLQDAFVEESVLGVMTLAHIIERGALVSRSEAARWASIRFDPRWQEIIREAWEIRTTRGRRRSLYEGSTGRLERRKAVRKVIHMVVQELRIGV